MDLSFCKQRNIFGADLVLEDFLRPSDLTYTIHNEIAPYINVRDFEDMYKEGGRRPVSPKVLMLVTIMQYLEKLSDRAAAYNLRYRIDWKIMLGLEIDFEGIHPTTLSYFRDRLIESKKASYAFDKVIEILKEKGLVKRDSKQRIDSTHIVGNVRELSRLDLYHETLQLFCNDISLFTDYMLEDLKEKYDLYSEDISTRGINDAQKKKYQRDAGLAMRAFIEWVNESPKELKIADYKSFQTLKTVFEQNFEDNGPSPDDPPKMKKIATGEGHICNPHDTDARYATKGAKGWIGYKLQVAESIEDNSKDEVNFITYIGVEDATTHDGKVIEPYVENQKEKSLLPSEVYGDTHFNTAENIEALDEEGVKLKGPVSPEPPQKDHTIGKNAGFTVKLTDKEIICPMGEKTRRFNIIVNGEKVSGTFPEETCQNCNRRDICKPQPHGKRIQIRVENETLKKRRKLMRTEEFKEDMHKRNGVEGTISGLVRGQGMRRARYKGKNKVMLQAKLSGAAANLSRLHRKIMLDRYADAA